MEPITPAKRRLAVALAVAVKNYARLQDRADELFEEAEYYNISGAGGVPWSVFRKIDKMRLEAAYAIWGAASNFARRKQREGAFQQLGRYDASPVARFVLAKKRFRRAAFKIAERGGFLRDDEDTLNILES